jgi:hypothetical protein
MNTRIVQQIIFTLLMTALANANYAASITLINNGDWSSATSWDLNRIPENGDIVNIPNGKTVQVTTNIYNVVPSQPHLEVNVYGSLLMSGTGQLNLSCESSVCVSGTGIIPATGCNCNQILFGTGEALWKGASASIVGGFCAPSSCTPLPVTLKTFEAQPEERSVRLSWTVAQEINLKHYEILRSADGIIFENIGTVQALNQLNENTYQFTDLQPLEGLSYYRLKIVDLNMTSNCTYLIKTNAELTASIEVYPNPAIGGNFNVLMPSSDFQQKFILVIKDMIGNECASHTYFQRGGYLPVPASSFTPGIYVLNVYSGNRTYTKKMILQ